MAALRLNDSPKEKPFLPSIPDAANNVSLKVKPSASKEPETIQATDLSMESILKKPPTNPSLLMKPSDVKQSTSEDKEDLAFLDNLLDTESTSTKPVEHPEKRDLDDEEWLDEFLGD